jgi:drug/metabolite transporter (DMT)-like permease
VSGTSPVARWQVWAGLATIYIVWGSTYLAIRVMVETVPPLLGAGLRFLLAGAMLLGTLAARRGPAAVRISRPAVGASAVVGTLLLFGGNGLVTVAERHVPSGLAALLIASVPLWVVVLRALARDRASRAMLLGVLAGFAGVAILMLPGSRPSGASAGGALLCLLAAGCWASGSFASTRLPLPADPLISTGWQMVIGGALMTAIGLGAGEAADVHAGQLSARSAWAFAYLVVAGSLLAFTAYAWLLQHAPISQVATYAYVNPVVAVVLGWVILGEDLTPATLLGAAVIVASVAWTVRPETGPPRARAPAPAGKEARSWAES